MEDKISKILQNSWPGPFHIITLLLPYLLLPFPKPPQPPPFTRSSQTLIPASKRHRFNHQNHDSPLKAKTTLTLNKLITIIFSSPTPPTLFRQPHRKRKRQSGPNPKTFKSHRQKNRIRTQTRNPNRFTRETRKGASLQSMHRRTNSPPPPKTQTTRTRSGTREIRVNQQRPTARNRYDEEEKSEI